MTVDEIIEAAQRGDDANKLRAEAVAITLSLPDLERQRLEAAMELWPRRSGLLVMGG